MKKIHRITVLFFVAVIMISAGTISPVRVTTKQVGASEINYAATSRLSENDKKDIANAVAFNHQGLILIEPATSASTIGSGSSGDILNNNSLDIPAFIPPAFLATDASVGAIVSPTPGTICSTLISPQITVRNNGTDILNSVEVGMLLDESPIGNITTLNNLLLAASAASAVISLPDFTPVAGEHILKIYTQRPNGVADLNDANDTAVVTFTTTPTLALTYKESFESGIFPPDNGSAIINRNPGSATWTRTTKAAGAGNASMTLNAFLYEQKGERDIYRTPKINVRSLDSVVLFFSVAYKQYKNVADSLLIVYSPDCGSTWLPTEYVKGGASLSTSPGLTDEEFVPTSSEWRVERVVLKDFCQGDLQSIMIGFESYNAYGNDIYVDGINIAGFARTQRNTSLNTISGPDFSVCSNNLTPVVSFRNEGTDTIRSLKVNYQIDGGAITTFNWSGSIAKCEIGTATFSTTTSTPGAHIITAFTSGPNGLDDFAASNDTLRKTFTIYNETPVPAPVFEGFETTGIPGWGIQNADALKTWERSTASAKTGIASLWINNPAVDNANSATDNFISPVIENSAAIDSMFVSFDYAYQAGAQYPGATVLPLDTLEILITKDCGASFASAWKKWGEDLQTVNDPNYSSSLIFIPANSGEWKSARVFLGPFVGANNFQVYFSAKSNKQNNIWLDNISISSKTLPQRLKNQGYLVYPNPFGNTFLVHHILAPVGLQAMQVFNSTGQLVWERHYKGNADTGINIDLGTYARGVYVLKMIYADKTVVERVVKD